MRPRLFLAAGAVMLVVVAPVFAKKPKKKTKQKADVTVSMTFAQQQREDVRLFFVREHGRGKGPPGLAKKNNGCLPPGQAKKRDAVRERLPATVELLALPVALSAQNGAPPAGCRYAIVDGDFVQLVLGTRLVVDAIEGLVE